MPRVHHPNWDAVQKVVLREQQIKEEKQIIGNVTFVLQNQKDEAF